MNEASTATASATPSEPTPAGAQQRAVPAPARQIAAQLSALFQRDVEIVKRLNDAHHRLANANERLSSGLAPDVLALTNGHTMTATIPTNPIATPPHHRVRSTTLDAVQQIHSQIHRALCAYQHAAEQRRQLAVDVGELSDQLTHTLRAAGWSADDARNANVHELARPDLRPALHADPGDYAAVRPA
jgi:hypothetical protein